MKKKYVLKRWVKITLKTLGAIAFMYLFYLAFRVTPEDRNAIDYCMDHGGTYEQCRKGVLGIYGG